MKPTLQCLALSSAVIAAHGTARATVTPTIVIAGTNASATPYLTYLPNSMTFDNSSRVPWYNRAAPVGVFSVGRVPTAGPQTYDFLGESGSTYDVPELSENNLCTGSCAMKRIASIGNCGRVGGSCEDAILALDSTGWVSEYNFGGTTADNATFNGSGSGWKHLGTQLTYSANQFLAAGSSTDTTFVAVTNAPSCSQTQGYQLNELGDNNTWIPEQTWKYQGTAPATDCVQNIAGTAAGLFYLVTDSGDLRQLWAGTNGTFCPTGTPYCFEDGWLAAETNLSACPSMPQNVSSFSMATYEGSGIPSDTVETAFVTGGGALWMFVSGKTSTFVEINPQLARNAGTYDCTVGIANVAFDAATGDMYWTTDTPQVCKLTAAQVATAVAAATCPPT